MPTDPIRSVVRFCFAKRDATLDAALERLGGALEARGVGRSAAQTGAMREAVPTLRFAPSYGSG